MMHRELATAIEALKFFYLSLDTYPTNRGEH
jgi:hypothetical protein